ncbi:MAG: FG-GAP-like repeat-containing protein [Candidatus Fermentibacteria bacterium]
MILMILILTASAPDTLWANVTSGGVYSTVAIGDINGDGVPDVASGLNYFDDEPTLWCLSGASGDTLWTSDQFNGIYQDEGLTGVQDMNADGYGDILMATPGGYAPPGRCLILISGIDGSLIWLWSAYENIPGGTGWGYSCCFMEDQTGDDLPEFIGGFGSTGGPNTSTAACINGASGDTLWTRTTADAVEDVLAVPDVTGDDVQEIYLGIGGSSYTDYTLELVDGSSGSLIWNRNGGGDVMCVSAVDREDTVPWLVSSSFSGEVQCYSLGGDSLWARDFGGMLLDVESGPDLNGDGIAEIAVAGDNSGTICLNGATGTTLWSYATGSNTWSVAWADSVYAGGAWVPCIVGGSVNGKRITLVDALSGNLIWEQPFTERVYNVSTVYMDTISPSPVVLTGLQDQQSQPFHSWAFLSSTGTSCEESPSELFAGSIVRQNPLQGIMFLTPPQGEWDCGIYDLSGRLVWSGKPDWEETVDVSSWKSGVYFVVLSNGSVELKKTVTVLN